MRSLLLDELTQAEVERIREYLDKWGVPTEVRGLYWIQLPPEQLTPLQEEHRDCGPHKFAVELDDDWLKVEFLIRPAVGLRCHCCGMAGKEQREFILDWADRLTERLDLGS